METKFACPYCGEHLLLPNLPRRRRWLIPVALAGLLAVAGVTFLPYGYSAYTDTFFIKKRADVMPAVTPKHRAWRFVGYRFVLSPPPTLDYDYRQMFNETDFGFTSTEITNMGVGWHIVAIELGATVVLAGVAFLLRRSA
jgi:hypothetical protein